jgi:hypothetical protein
MKHVMKYDFVNNFSACFPMVSSFKVGQGQVQGSSGQGQVQGSSGQAQGFSGQVQVTGQVLGQEVLGQGTGQEVTGQEALGQVIGQEAEGQVRSQEAEGRVRSHGVKGQASKARGGCRVPRCIQKASPSESLGESESCSSASDECPDLPGLALAAKVPVAGTGKGPGRAPPRAPSPSSLDGVHPGRVLGSGRPHRGRGAPARGSLVADSAQVRISLFPGASTGNPATKH